MSYQPPSPALDRSNAHGPFAPPDPLIPDAEPELTEAELSAAERSLRLAFAPLHKRAFGVAIGVTFALVIFVVTAARLLLDPAGRSNLSLLAEFFAGYTQSWMGAVIGAAWAFGVGFVGGWFAAFVRNLVLATWTFIARARAELAMSRDFLDHI